MATLEEPGTGTVYVATDDALVVRRVVFGALGVQLLLLAVTGVVLFGWYRPTGADAGMTAIGVVRVFHRWLSFLMAPSAIAGAVVLGMYGRSRRLLKGRSVPLATGVALVIATLAASFTGYLLPWDQLALWAVEAGSTFEGYRWLLGDDSVRFVLAGGTELSVNTVFWWMAGHVALGLALAALLAVGWGQVRPKA